MCATGGDVTLIKGLELCLETTRNQPKRITHRLDAREKNNSVSKCSTMPSESAEGR